MRVLCSTPPMEGLFAPFVPLGRALRAAGHEVVVATGADLEQRVRRDGFDTVVAGPTAMEGAAAAMAGESVTSAPDGEPWHFPATMFGGVIPSAKLPRLRQLADDLRPQLVVHPEVDLAAPLVAEVLDLRSVAYGFAQPLDPRRAAARRIGR